MRKPNEVVYGPLDAPPLAVVALSGVQHVAMMSIYLVYPVLIAQAVGATPEVAAAMVSLTLVALAIGTVLQVVPLGPIGSGYMCPPTSTVIYVIPALAAAGRGGLALVFGMTAFAGVAQAALARLLPKLRQYLPPEVAGLVSVLVGIATGVLGLRAILGPGTDGTPPDAHDVWIALVTLAIMVVLNVWGRGGLRMFCVLIGLVTGSAIAWAIGEAPTGTLVQVAGGPIFAWPSFAHVSYAFDPAFIGPYLVAAAVASIKVIGNVTTLQRANDDAWVRTDMVSVGRGSFADGLGNVVAGGLGVAGLNSSTGSVGLATATGVHSRRIAWSIAAILLALAFFPKLGLVVNALPRPVIGAALVFSSTFIVANGVEIMGSRLIDARRSLVIGLAIVCGLAVDLFPAAVASLPAGLQPMLGTPLMLGAIIALGLNLLFRIGVRQTESITVDASRVDPTAVRAFLDTQGARWAARRDVIERASFGLAQAVETIAGSGVARGAIDVSASFDEFNLDLRISYDGVPLELPEERPSLDDVLASEEGEHRLAGYMLRRCADRVTATRRGAGTTIHLHFDH